MYPTYGTHQIVSVTELRQDTADIIDHAKQTGDAVLVQRNNDPIAILISISTYERYQAIIECNSRRLNSIQLAIFLWVEIIW